MADDRQKVAVVVGAGAGFGFAARTALMALGWKVYSWDKDTGWFDDGVEVRQLDPDDPACEVPVQVDVRWADEVKLAATEIEETRVDAVIYAPRERAMRSEVFLSSLSGDLWEVYMDTNAKGLLLVTQALLPRLYDTRGRELAGTLVAVTRSEEGWASFPSLSASSSLRSGLADDLMNAGCVTVFGMSLVAYQPDIPRAAELLAFLLSSKERHLSLHSLDIPYGS